MIQLGDFLDLSHDWPDPTVIVCDGPYGVPMVEGEPRSVEALPEWYAPYLDRFTERSTTETTLWFWGTEVSWATMHPEITRRGWVYRACNIWDKGIGYVAGNVNTQTIRHYPVVTEVCAQYIRQPFVIVGGEEIKTRNWIRSEWQRTGLPMRLANDACGVKNAATRKYLTNDDEWYMPPPEMLERLRAYANEHGDPLGYPYFADLPELTGRDRSYLRGKFNCDVGITNVWREPSVRGKERVKIDGRAVHPQQKPLSLVERIIAASSDPGDVIWEPFGGMCTVAVAAGKLGRECYSAEILPEYYDYARARLESIANEVAIPTP